MAELKANFDNPNICKEYVNRLYNLNVTADRDARRSDGSDESEAARQ